MSHSAALSLLPLLHTRLLAPLLMMATWVSAWGWRPNPLRGRTVLPHHRAWSLAVGRFSVLSAMMLEGSRKKEQF